MKPALMNTFTRHSAWLLALAMTASVAQAQTFTNASNLLPDTYNSGGCVGFADMDGDGTVQVSDLLNLLSVYGTAC